MASSPSKRALIAEFLVLFLLLPFAVLLKPVHLSPLPALWLLFAYCYWQLRRDASFDRSLLWNSSQMGKFAPAILITFALAAILITFCVWRFAPARLFTLVHTHPIFWAIIMCFYPVLSVYPQSVIYRAFLFQRYRSIVPGSSVLIMVSAVAFSFIHIIFRNPIAPLFTFFGGLLFAYRYHRSRSLFVSAFEHSLYGCLMFTVGLGSYFYHGAVLAH